MAKKVVIKRASDTAAPRPESNQLPRPVPPAPPPPRAASNGPARAEPTRGGSRRGETRPPPPLDLRPSGGEEHRQFPRARMTVRFSLWIGEGDDRRFQASLTSSNLSVSGAFLDSKFFLPVGTEIRVSFEPEPGEDPVQARAQIVREERPDGRTGEGRSGLAIRFVEFFGQTEVTLAKLFLGEKLREFSETYLQSKRARSLTNELDRVVDALAAWELLKVTTPGDPWRSA